MTKTLDPATATPKKITEYADAQALDFASDPDAVYPTKCGILMTWIWLLCE